MADPFRLRVLQNLTAALQEITPANGYEHDLSSSVFRGRDYYGDDDPVPMISILEAADEIGQAPTPNGGTTQAVFWALTVQGFVQDDKENPTDPAQRLMAEVRKRLVQERIKAQYKTPNTPKYDILGLSGRVVDITISPGIVRPPDAISALAYFWLHVNLKIVEDLLDPYS